MQNLLFWSCGCWLLIFGSKCTTRLLHHRLDLGFVAKFFLLDPSWKIFDCLRSTIHALACINPVTVHIDCGAKNIDFCTEFLGASWAFCCSNELLAIQGACDALRLVIAKWTSERHVKLLHHLLALWQPCRFALPHDFKFLKSTDTKWYAICNKQGLVRLTICTKKNLHMKKLGHISMSICT